MSDDWRPRSSRQVLEKRGWLLSRIRGFMAEHSILEVETPILDSSGNPDPNINNLTTQVSSPKKTQKHTQYLHTSPEFGMKKLLASGSGPIYQITKVFRDSEMGQMHQPEFTMLEWYRPGFDHHSLMDELTALLEDLLSAESERSTYGQVFELYCGFNPHEANMSKLLEYASDLGLVSSDKRRSVLLDFIFSRRVAPELGKGLPILIFDYPACQAALAKIRHCEIDVAERFELFINGMEIANGYNELTNSIEQESRFEEEGRIRESLGAPHVKIDTRLLAALEEGLPDCAGVAVGLDRLLMVITGSKHIQDVIAFPQSTI